jgi:hypothetical protein
MTLADRLQMLDQDGALGLATLCVGGGQGMSVLARYVKLAGSDRKGILTKRQRDDVTECS